MNRFFRSLFRSPKTTRTPAARTRLGLEALDDRRLPSVSYSWSDGGHTLNIIGDDSTNYVDLFDNDDGDYFPGSFVGRKFSLNGPGTDALIACSVDPAMVTKVVVDLKGGDDHFEYRYEGSSIRFPKDITIRTGDGEDQCWVTHTTVSNHSPHKHEGTECRTTFTVRVDTGNQDDELIVGMPLVSGNVNVTAELGTGDDEARMIMSGPVTTGGKVDMTVFGRADDDTLSFHGYSSDDYRGKSGVETGGRLDVFLIGGDHRDTIDINFDGQARGAVNLWGVGGGGDDTLNMNLRLTDGSHGNVSAILQGSTDHDTLEFKLEKVGQVAGGNTYLIDGGPSIDFATDLTSLGVSILSCEEDHLFLTWNPYVRR